VCSLEPVLAEAEPAEAVEHVPVVRGEIASVGEEPVGARQVTAAVGEREADEVEGTDVIRIGREDPIAELDRAIGVALAPLEGGEPVEELEVARVRLEGGAEDRARVGGAPAQ